MGAAVKVRKDFKLMAPKLGSEKSRAAITQSQASAKITAKPNRERANQRGEGKSENTSAIDGSKASAASKLNYCSHSREKEKWSPLQEK